MLMEIFVLVRVNSFAMLSATSEGHRKSRKLFPTVKMAEMCGDVPIYLKSESCFFISFTITALNVKTNFCEQTV